MFSGNLNAQSFITTWQTDNPGSSADNQITIPKTGAGYDYSIVWTEVGNPANTGSLTNVTGNVTIDFPSAGTYRVEIDGLFPRIFFNAASFLPDGDSKKILTVEQWGNIAWTSMVSAFSGCTNLTVPATDAPDLSGVTDMTFMFRDATLFNADISGWDVSGVTIMEGIFRDAVAFNQPLNTWDVSSVTDMSYMFFFARDFNQDIGGWDVSNVTTMALMFGGASSFNQDIGNWDVRNVVSMDQMLSGAAAFNQDVGGWEISSATNIRSLFRSCPLFNQDISFKPGGGNRGGDAWNTSGVTNMSLMFGGATAFNQDISGWDVSNVNNMSGMFSGAVAFDQDITGWQVNNVNDMNGMFENHPTFNQDISGWQVGNVTNMNSMFAGAAMFNQDISGWDVVNVSDMRSMFAGAVSFDQNLGGWDVSNVRFMFNMLSNSGMSVANYDNALIGWNSLPSLRTNVNLGASGVSYCSAQSARDNLIATYNWFITDDGQGCIAVFEGPNTSGIEINDGQSAPIDFGSTSAGVPKTRDFTIDNLLAGNLTNVNISVTGTTFVVGAFPTTINAGTSITFDIDLISTGLGSFTEMVSITSDDFTGAFEFPVTGVVTATPEPEIVVFEAATAGGADIMDGQPIPVNFGNEERGTDLIGEFNITNIGSAVLNISSISISGTAFSLVSTAPPSIAVGNVETIQVRLNSSVAGIFSETVTINNDDTDEGAFDFIIEGEIIGPDIAVFDGTDIFSDPEIFAGQATAIDFGSGPAGADIVRQITIANFNPVDLIVSNISVSGTAFTVTAATPFTVDAEVDGIISRITFDVTLSGAAGGTFNETLTITSDDDDEPTFDFPITGEITTGPEPEIAVFEGAGIAGTEIIDGQATAVDFGVGVQPADIIQQITIQNSGTATLSISSISISGSAFSLSATPPTSIAAGNTETIDIILSGASIGTFSETVTITSNDINEATFDFPITGQITAAPEPEIAVYNGPDNTSPQITDGQATAISFGSGDQGTDIDRVITIENIGSADLSISGIAISGTAFSSMASTPFTLSPGSTAGITIRLSGAVDGTFSETVTITNNDADENPFEFPVTGTINIPNTPPTITNISDLMVDEDGTTGDINFMISDAETPSRALVVTVSTSNPGLVSNSEIVLGGSDDNRTLSITPVPDANGIVDITLEVSDGVDTATETFILTVNAVNDAPMITGQSPLMTPQNQPIDIALSDFNVTDIDNNFPTGFTLVVSDGNDYSVAGNTITPDLDFVGMLIVPVVVNDGVDDSPVFNAMIEVIAGEIEVVIDGAGLLNGGNVSFSDALVGTSESQELIISNSGTVDLIITDIIISGTDFSLESGIPAPIPPGGQSPIELSFEPTTPGLKTGQLTIVSSSAEDFVLSISATAFTEIPPIEVINVVTTALNGKHDYLEIRNIEFYPDNRVFIYTRWGDEVFKVSRYDNSSVRFDGDTDGGKELAEGTYYYVIELNGGETIENGFFLLRR